MILHATGAPKRRALQHNCGINPNKLSITIILELTYAHIVSILTSGPLDAYFEQIVVEVSLLTSLLPLPHSSVEFPHFLCTFAKYPLKTVS